MIKVIRTRSDYDAALAAIEELMDREPANGSADADKLELLSLLVEDYEKKHVPVQLPSPLDAIRFRMEQGGLSQRALIPFIGSKSKVSEVLAGKRPLTLPMIRALHTGLGIPAQVLLQDHESADLEPSGIEWDRFPVAEMIRRKWIDTKLTAIAAKEDAERLLKSYFKPIGGPQAIVAMYKRTRHVRAGRAMNKYALAAWTGRLMLRAVELELKQKYVAGSVTNEFMTEVARLSWFGQGPQLAREFLGRHGIALIIEPHLPGTQVDGAALLLDDGRPVIGISVRHDRVDNFWFCLLHELSHLALHLKNGESGQFIDDLDTDAQGDTKEEEADELAGNILVPESEWRASAASMGRAPIAIRMLASELRIHPGIIAGKIRRQYNDYRVLNDLVGRGDVRKQFTDVLWD